MNVDHTTHSAIALEVRRLAALVAELVDENRTLQRRLLAAEDRRIGAVVLPLLAELVGQQPFTAASIATHALNDRTVAGRAVREVLADLGADDGGLRSFGRLLQRLDGVPLAGLRLLPAGQRREGLAWRLVHVSGR